MQETQFLIVGAGIVGLTLARELLVQGAERIIVIDKESAVGKHASGRNSGVLHAGIYYPPNTLKAKLCLQGNLLMQEYCQQKNLPLRNTGKVIVASHENEIPVLADLYARAKTNGAKVDLLDEKQLAEVEPHARTCKQAIYSHYTAMVDNQKILESLQSDLLLSGRVKFLFSALFGKLRNQNIAVTTKGEIRFEYFINSAGAYADKVARHFAVGKDYYLIPFKGIYKKLQPAKKHLVNGNIYPVPNLGNPFLGVHFTKNVHGDVYVGPTAIPALGRENYGIWQGMDREMVKILYQELTLFCVNAEFRKVAKEETRKYITTYFYRDARKLVKELQPDWLLRTSKAGIRPQLVSVRERKLVMDFLVIKEGQSLHILNAISPAFTSSMAFAKYIVQKYII